MLVRQGADTLKGGDGIDLAAYWDSDAAVEVRLYDGFAQGGHAEGDTFSTALNNLDGSDHDDKLAGDAGENHLSKGGTRVVTMSCTAVRAQIPSLGARGRTRWWEETA